MEISVTIVRAMVSPALTQSCLDVFTGVLLTAPDKRITAPSVSSIGNKQETIAALTSPIIIALCRYSYSRDCAVVSDMQPWLQ